HAGRRQVARPPDAAAPGADASRGRAGGHHERQRARRHPGHRARSALMALTGRTALLALVGAALVLVVPGGWWVLLATWGLVLVGVCADLLLAGSVARLRVSRSGDQSCRLDDTATVTLIVANPGTRRVRGLLRDAWSPSAGAAPRR